MNYQMRSLYLILWKNYRLVKGLGKDGGYHTEITPSLYSKIDGK